MDIIHGYHPWIISIDITHGIPWGVPWDPRGGTMGTPWVGSLSLLGLMGPLGLIGPLGLMGPQGLMGPGPWALGHGFRSFFGYVWKFLALRAPAEAAPGPRAIILIIFSIFDFWPPDPLDRPDVPLGPFCEIMFFMIF